MNSNINQHPAFDPWEKSEQPYDILDIRGNVAIATKLSHRSAVANTPYGGNGVNEREYCILESRSTTMWTPSTMFASDDQVVRIIEVGVSDTTQTREQRFEASSERISDFFNLVWYAHVSDRIDNFTLFYIEGDAYVATDNAKDSYDQAVKDFIETTFNNLCPYRKFIVNIDQNRKRHSAREKIAANLGLDEIMEHIETKNK